MGGEEGEDLGLMGGEEGLEGELPPVMPPEEEESESLAVPKLGRAKR